MASASATPRDATLPLFVLRAHRSPIHTITIIEKKRSNATGQTIIPVTQYALPTIESAGAAMRLLSGDASGAVLIWDLHTRRIEHRLTAHTAPVLAIHQLDDGKIITQGKDGLIHIWDLPVNANQPIATIATGSYTFFKSQLIELGGVPNDAVEASSSSASLSLTKSPIHFSSRPLLLVPCEEASCMALYDLSHSLIDPIQLIELDNRIPRDHDFEERIRDRLSNSEAKELEDLLAQQPVQYERKVGMAMAAKFFQSPSALANHSPTAPTYSPHLELADLNICWGSESGIMGVWSFLSFDLNWRGSFGIACSSSNTFHAFSLHLPTTQDGVDSISSKPLHLIGTVELPHEGLAEVVIRPDGRLFATGGWDHRVRLFDCSTLQPLAILREHTATIQCVATPIQSHGSTPSPQLTSFIASGAKDGKIAVYKIYDETDQANTNGSSGAVSPLSKHRQLYAQRHPTTIANRTTPSVP